MNKLEQELEFSKKYISRAKRYSLDVLKSKINVNIAHFYKTKLMIRQFFQYYFDIRNLLKI